jgi:hypothetical protein
MKKVIFSFLVMLSLTACSVLDLLPTRETEVPLTGSVLLSDTFSNVETGWKTWNQDGSFVIYQVDGLRFYIDKANLDFWSTPGYQFQDVRIEVEAIKIDGPDNNSYGVICRMQDDKNFYAFVISSDGYAGIIKVEEGIYQLINDQSMEFASSINKGRAINNLSVTCEGNQLSFDINGEKQFSITDDGFLNGEVGLIAGSFDEPGVDIFFDNLSVFQP